MSSLLALCVSRLFSLLRFLRPGRFTCGALLLLSTLPTFAAPGRDMVREAEIEAQLTQLDSTQLEPFRQARIAYDSGDYPKAAQLLTAICAKLPQFDPAFRRWGAAVAQQGDQVNGLRLLEHAVELNRSTANLITLASTLAFPKAGMATQADRERALALAVECRSLPHGLEEDILGTIVHIAITLNRPEEAHRTSAEMLEKFPEGAISHYFAGIVAAYDEQWGRAERELRLSQKFGMPDEAVQRLLDSGIESNARVWRLVGISLGTIGAWVAGLLLLFISGMALSKITLRQARAADVSQAVTSGEHKLRRLYRWVIGIAGVYYYLSLPIVLVLVIGACGAIVYGFLLVGWLPLKLTAILIIGALATIWTMGRSLFLKVNSADPGRALLRDEAEGLWLLAEDVARTMNTRPIDEIRLTEGTDLAVYERGTWRQKMENKAQRILIVGVGVLDGFKQDDFRAVLAHEYGHFANRDTAGGDIAMRVQNDMVKFFHAMIHAGQASYLNVAFHFLRIYHFIFRRISHGATRLQEILADRVAAQTYGKVAFESGLRHVIRQSIAFGTRANQEVEEALKGKRPLQNLYVAAASPAATEQEEYDKAISRPTTEDDTHPGPLDRFAMIAQIPAPQRAPASGFVWELFRDREAITREMMAAIEKNLAAHRN